MILHILMNAINAYERYESSLEWKHWNYLSAHTIGEKHHCKSYLDEFSYQVVSNCLHYELLAPQE